MSLAPDRVDALCERLEGAEAAAEPIAALSGEVPGLDEAQAYTIQEALLRRRLARGSRLSGLKMGLTSFAKMKQMGVEQPIMGFLCSDHARPENSAVDTGDLIHPKVEPEIAMITAAEIAGADLTHEAIAEAIDCAVPALEILDSRYQAFRFDLPSVIADNCSTSRYVTGGRARRLAGLDLVTLGCVLLKNGELVHTGAGGAVLGHPLESVRLLAAMLAARGRTIPAGALLLTGGLTPAVAVAAGDVVTVRFAELGGFSVSFR